MAIIYGVGLAMALLIGGAIGLLLTAAHYELIASRQRGYEKEIARGPDRYAAQVMLRHLRPGRPSDDEASAA
jgi:hypothetical protein